MWSVMVSFFSPCCLAFLRDCSPCGRPGEGCSEVYRVEPRRKADVPFGTVEFEAAQPKEHAVARHAACVVVTTFDFVPRVVFRRMRTVVDATADSQGFGDHPLPGHVPCHLILNTGPDLVFVANAFVHVVGLGPSASKQSGFARAGKPPPGWMGVVLRANVGSPIVFPN